LLFIVIALGLEVDLLAIVIDICILNSDKFVLIGINNLRRLVSLSNLSTSPRNVRQKAKRRTRNFLRFAKGISKRKIIWSTVWYELLVISNSFFG
jgi:hypothetical protein